LRSLEDREWARLLLSRMANALVGDLSVLGMASSSIVFPRDLEGASVSVRLRMVMPWRCRSLRFCACQPQQAVSPTLGRTHGSSHGRSRGGRGSGAPGPRVWSAIYVARAAWELQVGGAHEVGTQCLIDACFDNLAGALENNPQHFMVGMHRTVGVNGRGGVVLESAGHPR
jgi:hypothetical protein